MWNKTLEELFWPKVDKSGDCWIWTAYRTKQGYGRLKVKTVHQKLAHRLAWEFAKGPVPDGLFVLHRCDNPPCVNPDHLFLGTLIDNNLDRARKGRSGTTRACTRPNAKITNEIISAILADTRSNRQIALAVGVSRASVIRVKQAHAHVDGLQGHVTR
jgi:hypothetical protein